MMGSFKKEQNSGRLQNKAFTQTRFDGIH